MKGEFEISAAWERLTDGPPEERACFGMLTVRAGSRFLSEGIDGFVNCRRDGPLVSGYHLAEWLAWNWWRLTAEPRRTKESLDWAFAHRISTVGSGYVWPDIAIWSDLQRTMVVVKPSRKDGFAPFRYTSDWSLVMPTHEFENAVDRFVSQVQGRLRAEDVASTNLDCVWAELLAERTDPDISRRRRLEALLGSDPDEANLSVIDRLVQDADRLGQQAIIEIAADHEDGGRPVTADDIITLAKAHGVASSTLLPQVLGDIHRFAPVSALCDIPAWKRGSDTAIAFRREQELGDGPLSDRKLADLAGISPQEIARRKAAAPISFAVDISPNDRRIVFRSKWKEGRRFELARLLGDRLAWGADESLIPATRAYTYRQKMQRSFAAEFLCPFEALKAFLSEDYSSESIESAAEYFRVSPLTIRTLLVNHNVLPREGLEDDLETSLAA